MAPAVGQLRNPPQGPGKIPRCFWALSMSLLMYTAPWNSTWTIPGTVSLWASLTRGCIPLSEVLSSPAVLTGGMSGGGVGESGGDCLELSSLHEAAPLLGMLSQLNLCRTRAYATSSRKRSQIASSSFLSLLGSMFSWHSVEYFACWI